MKDFRPDRLARSVELFYEAAAQPALWRTALHEFSQAAGAEGAILHANPLGKSPVHVHSEALDASFPKFLQDGWHLRNEPLRRVPSTAAPPVLTEATLFAPGDYMRDPLNMEFLRPHGFGWFAGLQALQSPAGDFIVSLQRSWRAEPFSRGEVAVLSRLMPHLRRAARIALLIGPARAEGMLDGFALLEMPAFLIGRDGIVTRMNGQANRLLGRGLDVTGGRLRAAVPSASKALHRLCAGLVADRPVWEADLPDSICVPRPFGHGLLVHGAPLPLAVRDPFGQARAVLVATDLDAGRSRELLHLARLCGLTRAEAETAAAIAAGLDFGEVAVRRGVGVETVRSQAKSIGVKTGASTRGEMVMLLNRMLGHVLDTVNAP